MAFRSKHRLPWLLRSMQQALRSPGSSGTTPPHTQPSSSPRLLPPPHQSARAPDGFRSASAHSRFACDAAPKQAAAAGAGNDEGIRFLYEHPGRRLRLKRPSTLRSKPTDVRPQVDVMIEGKPVGWARGKLEALAGEVGMDAGQALRLALLHKSQDDPKFKLPRIASLSLVLCDDPYIRALNLQHRNKDAATDVLSFEMGDEVTSKVHLPMRLLGDVVVSLDTAKRQAKERGHSLEDEVRVLLVHGILHLCGMDHERGGAEAAAMAAEEQRMMATLGWRGKGLISAMEEMAEEEEGEQGGGEGQAGGLGSIWVAAGTGKGGRSDVIRRAAVAAGRGGAAAPPSAPPLPKAPAPSGVRAAGAPAAGAPGARGGVAAAAAGGAAPAASPLPSRRQLRSNEIQLVALDMDGTLLDSTSRIRSSSVAAIKAAFALGVRVVLATGKARPAAIKACKQFGLEGEGLLVSSKGPGIFLQGLAVHGPGGTQLSDSELPTSVVQAAFRYAEGLGSTLSMCAFLGDECSTLHMSPDVRLLNTRYYEPLARVEPSLEALLAGPRVKKLVFMADPEVIDAQIRPHWQALLQQPQQQADLLQAVPNMLELVPRGVDKWVGAQVLLRALGVARERFMAVGDGGNDLAMVANAGVGVAMGNAVPGVQAAAAAVVASHDEDGIAEAFERFVL